MRRRQTRRIGAALVAATVLALTGAACSSGGDDAGSEAQVGGDEAAATTTASTADEAAGTGGDSSDGGTNLDTSQSDAESDLERQVSETLSDLDAEVVEGDTVIALPSEVLFDFDQSQLRPDAAATLDRIAQAIVFFADAPVQVAGHTDAHGADDYNQQLSEQRAQSVVDHLVAAGVDTARITAQGFGETQPVAPNENPDGSDNPQGRAENRRVEIVIEGVDPAEIGQ
ncbi:MAG: OmpA family protein [Acidimicrobiales bacterium]